MRLQERSLNIFGSVLIRTRELVVEALEQLARGELKDLEFMNSIQEIFVTLIDETNFKEIDPKNEIRFPRKSAFYKDIETALKNLDSEDEIDLNSNCADIANNAYLVYSQIRTYIYKEAIDHLKKGKKPAKLVETQVLPAIYNLERSLKEAIKIVFRNLVEFKLGMSDGSLTHKDDKFDKKKQILEAIENKFSNMEMTNLKRKREIEDFLRHCGFGDFPAQENKLRRVQ